MVQKVVILGTGGTIAGTAASPGDVTGYTAAQLGIDQLVAAIPALREMALVTEQVAQVDSKDMSHAIWCQLARRVSHWLQDASVQGIVITHGTDTLEETAYFLQAVLSPTKPVVLTCAMRPATALAPDGPQNIVDAVVVASTHGARGVLAVCAGAVHGARDVRKVHTYRLDAFSSGDAGALGYVEEGAVRQVRPWPDAPALIALEKATRDREWPRVEIVTSHAGAGGALVQALVAQGIDGIVVAGTGNGTLHRDLEAALREARAAGVQVVCATRCEQGRVIPVAGRDFADSRGLSPVKARIALMLELMA